MISKYYNKTSFSSNRNRNKPYFFNKKKPYFRKKLFFRRSFKKPLKRFLFVSTRFFKFFLQRKSRRPLFRSAKQFSRGFFISQPPCFVPSVKPNVDSTLVNFSLFSKEFSVEALQTHYSRRLSKRFLRAYLKTYRLSFYDQFAKAFFKKSLKTKSSKMKSFVKSTLRPAKVLLSHPRFLSFLRSLAWRKARLDFKLKKLLGVKGLCFFAFPRPAKKVISKTEANKKFFIKLLNEIHKKPQPVAVEKKLKTKTKIKVFLPKVQRLPAAFLRPTKGFRRISLIRFKVQFSRRFLRNRIMSSFMSKARQKFLAKVFGARFFKKISKSKKGRKVVNKFSVKVKKIFIPRFSVHRADPSSSSGRHIKIPILHKISRASKRIRSGTFMAKEVPRRTPRPVSVLKAVTKGFAQQQPAASFKHKSFQKKAPWPSSVGTSFRKDLSLKRAGKVFLGKPSNKNFVTKKSGFVAFNSKKDFRGRPTLNSRNNFRNGFKRPNRPFPAEVLGPRSYVKFQGIRKGFSPKVSHYFSKSLFKNLRSRKVLGRLRRPKPRLVVSLLGRKRRFRFGPSLKRKKKSPLFSFLKKQLKILRAKKVQRRLIFNRFSFQFHGAPRQRKIWISSLFYKRHWAFRSLFLFFRKFRVLRRRVRQGVALDFSGYGERFRWPSRIHSQRIIYPSHLWELVTQKAYRLMRYLRDLASLTKFLKPSRSHQIMLFKLHMWYTKGWALKLPPSFFGVTSSPRFLHPAGLSQKNSAFFFVFWRPLWDTFDQFLLLEDYYSEWIRYDSIWPVILYNFLGASRPVFSKVLSSIFLFQFVDREFRFWSSVFHNLFLMKDFSISSYQFLKKFTVIVANPLWYLHQLNRLILVLPFLPKAFRLSFFTNYRVISAFCWYKANEKKDLVVDATTKSLERMDYWFRHQSKYFRKQQKKSSRFLLFSRFFKMLRHTLLHRWLGHFKSPSKGYLRRQFKLLFLSKNLLFLSKIAVFPFSKIRLLFLKKKSFSRIKARRFQRPPTLQLLKEYPQSVLLKQGNLWRLLLFWSLFFSHRFHFQQRFFNLSQWLLCASNFFSFPVTSSILSLESVWGNILNRSLFLENPFRVACFHWIFSKPSQSIYQRHSFRKSIFHHFFFPSQHRESQPIPNFYKRYNYIRKLPFRYFRQFWPQSANFPRLTKFKIYRKPARSFLTLQFHLVQPFSYVSHGPRSYQQLVWGLNPVAPLKFSRQPF